PRLQRMHVATRYEAAHALRVSVSCNVHPCNFPSFWAHVVPTLLRLYDPRKRNQRIISCRRELTEHTAIPKRRILSPLCSALLHPRPGHKARNNHAAFFDVRSIKGANGVLHVLRIVEVAVKHRPGFEWVPDVQDVCSLRSEQSRWDAFVNRCIHFSAFVHDHEKLTRTRVNTLEVTRIINREAFGVPTRTAPYLRLQEL